MKRPLRTQTECMVQSAQICRQRPAPDGKRPRVGAVQRSSLPQSGPERSVLDRARPSEPDTSGPAVGSGPIDCPQLTPFYILQDGTYLWTR